LFEGDDTLKQFASPQFRVGDLIDLFNLNRGQGLDRLGLQLDLRFAIFGEFPVG